MKIGITEGCIMYILFMTVLLFAIKSFISTTNVLMSHSSCDPVTLFYQWVLLLDCGIVIILIICHQLVDIIIIILSTFITSRGC